MNKLLFETTLQLFDNSQMKIMKPSQIIDSKTPSIEYKEQKIIRELPDNNKSIIGNKSLIITTRNKILPKKNLCSFDNYMKENK